MKQYLKCYIVSIDFYRHRTDISNNVYIRNNYSPPGKLPTSKASLGDLNPTTAVTSELWGAPKASRGPPPGLSAKGSAGVIANGWSGVNSMPWGAGGGQRSSGNWGGSSQWLLLRNLTAQVRINFKHRRNIVDLKHF